MEPLDVGTPVTPRMNGSFGIPMAPILLMVPMATKEPKDRPGSLFQQVLGPGSGLVKIARAGILLGPEFFVGCTRFASTF